MRGQRAASGRRQRGVASIELVLVLPILATLVFGVVEFGKAWAQKTDVQHGAREVARLAAVNDGAPDLSGDAQTAAIVAEACSHMQDSAGAEVTISFETVGGTSAGDVIVVEIDQAFDPVTGIVPISPTLSGRVELLLERDATWAATSSPVPC